MRIKYSIILILFLILLQYFFIKFCLFSYFPYIGYVFHLIGDYCVVAIVYHYFFTALSVLPKLVLLITLGGAVAIAAIGWEVLEFIFSPGVHHLLNQNVYAVLEDEVVSVMGGVVFGVMKDEL